MYLLIFLAFYNFLAINIIMIKKLLLLWLIGSTTCFAINNISDATNINPIIETKLYLEDIIVTTNVNNKKYKDKIYIQITEYSDIKHAKEYRIPMYPKHWLQQDLLKLKNILLWHNLVESLESKKLIISLVEQEFQPLESDQSLGSIKLILDNKNQGKKMRINWDVAGFKEKIQIKKIINKKSPNTIMFNMQGKNGDYIVKFYVKTKIYK